MTEPIKNLIYAIAADKASDISSNFNDTMAQKMREAIAIKKEQVANNIFKKNKD